MLAKSLCGAIIGVDGTVIEVEADVSPGLFAFEIVGLPDSAVRESRERVRSAVGNSGFEFPVKRITVNLAPADVRKEGAGFDLAIAAAILECCGAIPRTDHKSFVAGELGLDGSVRPISGALPMAAGAKAAGITTLFVPAENAAEAALVEGATVFPVKSLSDFVEHMRGKRPLSPVKLDARALFEQRTDTADALDFADVKGQENVKRALTIAAAGGHNVLLIGPPGTGKTMAAKRLPTIMPPMSFEDSIECLKIYSVAGLLRDKGATFAKRPFRSPHHSLSLSAMTGGGKFPKPGEISLSHNGVLFLDELPEFDKATLESLRQPMEDGRVVISRVNGTVEYPADFMLAAGMNPCPCGYYGDPSGKCSCNPSAVGRYLSRVSGPLLDRIDVMVEAGRVDYDKLRAERPGKSSADMRAEVLAARERQTRRQGSVVNARLTPKQTDAFCCLDKDGERTLKSAFDAIGLSARAYGKVLKLARTIADLDGGEAISARHVAEAAQYRALDKTFAEMRGMR